jgi:hypothetical protein
MKISDLRELLNNKLVIEEIHKHLWIESQKAGYNIGIERATDEWLRLYAEGWMKYNMPKRYSSLKKEQAKGSAAKAKPAAKPAVKIKNKASNNMLSLLSG